MIDLKQLLVIHEILIEKFGGSKGIRDINGLDSAIHRPFQTFNQVDLYPTVLEKAAALFESLIITHPFIDGNKRTDYVAMRLFLLENNFDISCTEQEKYKLVISASEGKSNYKAIYQWLTINNQKLS